MLSRMLPMMLRATLVWGVTLISAGFSSKMMTLAFVQNDRNYRQCDRTAVLENGERRLKGFESPDVAFSFSPSSLSSLLSANSNQSEDADPDLFDYFDPLLSPHAYPSGISPNQKPSIESNGEIKQERQYSSQQKEDSGSKGKFGIRLPNTEQNDEKKSSTSPSKSTATATKGEFGFKIRPNPPESSPAMEQKSNEEEVDLFEYFDPLRSPHEYPDGIKPKKELVSSVITPSALEVVGDDEDSIKSSYTTNLKSNGKKKKIGVLLMDHGSKKEKSNARLEAMAKLYQLTSGTDEDEEDETTPTIIVRAAHMEIAPPSIPDGLKELKDLGVDEIICHPFFLSADGRHVKEDIPEIIGNAIEDLWGEKTGATPIPIVTTAPVGSNTQLMLGAIHSLVRENSQYLKTTLQNEA